MPNLPNEFVHLNRYNARMLELLVSLSQLHESVQSYASEPTIDNMQGLEAKAEATESRLEAMKHSLASLLREISSDEESDTVDAEQTEHGYRL